MTKIILTSPIIIDGVDTSEIILRKPNAGELRGLKLSDILQMDVNAMLHFLPRITQPSLSAQQIGTLDPMDFTNIAAGAVGFLVHHQAN